MPRKSKSRSESNFGESEPVSPPDISEIVLQLQPRLIKPVHGSPLIEIPIGNIADVEKQLHPIMSNATRGELSFIIQRELGRTPSREETTRLTLFLLGVANRTPIQKQSFEEAAEHSPLVEALMIFLRSEANGFFRGTVSQLIDQLAQIKESEHFQDRSGGWSDHSNVFGKQLKTISLTLPEFGIEFRRDRTTRSRGVTLQLLTEHDGRMTEELSSEYATKSMSGDAYDSDDSFDPSSFQHLELERGTT